MLCCDAAFAYAGVGLASCGQVQTSEVGCCAKDCYVLPGHNFDVTELVLCFGSPMA